MTCFIRRTWTEIDLSENDTGGKRKEPRSGSPEDYRDCSALVLLGAPGAGKTKCLEQEAEEGRGCYVTARNFIARNSDNHPEWRHGPLLIDGLDEVRAGAQDFREPLDKIGTKLEELGYPAFRLSCREAAWFGTNDSNALRFTNAYSDLCVVRLDPLSKEEDILAILSTVSDVPDPKNFIEQTKNMGFELLLRNPQSLKLLALAVGENGWPKSQAEIFERACEELLMEVNSDHQMVESNSTLAEGTLLNRASRMCALQLLSGAAGWTVNPTHPNRGDKEFLTLAKLQTENTGHYRRILDTMLFAPVGGRDGTGLFTVHRQIAEYLGARFLKECLRERVPLGRVLALMIDGDGMVVAPLQGLAAWLAVLCQETRGEIVDCNPLGMILNVDLSSFSTGDRAALFRRLREEAEKNLWFWQARSINLRLDDLLSTDMIEEIGQAFEASSSSDVRRGFARLLAEELHLGKSALSMLDFLLSGLRKETWDPAVKKAILPKLIHHWKGDLEGSKRLADLLRDFNSKEILDPDDQLTGQLLKELYPDVVGVPEVFDYLRPRRDKNLIGSYYLFWTSDFFDLGELSCDQYCKFLDSFAERVATQQQGGLEATHALEQEVFLIFLTKYLESSGNDIEEEKLFMWLDAIEWGLGDVHRLTLSELSEVQKCFHDRPNFCMALLELGLDRHAEIGSLNQLEKKMREIEHFLFANEPPAEFGVWCLKQAEEANSPLIARYFARCLAQLLHRGTGNRELSSEDIVARLKPMPEAFEAYQDLRSQFDQAQEGEEEFAQRRKSRRAKERAERRSELKQYENELRKNKVPLDLLAHLATAYLGGYRDVPGDTPHERLTELLDGDGDLVQAALAGLRGCVGRDDLPTPKEVIRFTTQKLRHLLVWPFMAGMEELAREADGEDFPLNEEQARLALTIHYIGIVPRFIGGKALPYPPSWYETALSKYPDCAKESLIKVARSLMRAGHSMKEVFDFLVNRMNHYEIACAVLPLLLKSFPVRCSQTQLDDLRILLFGALRYCKRDVLLGLVQSKLALASMNSAQRIYWFGIGFHLEPSLYLRDMEDYIGRKEKRISYLLDIVSFGEGHVSSGPKRDAELCSLLIRLGGSVYRPWSLTQDNNPTWTSGAMFRSNMVADCIECLASSSSNYATEELEILKDDERLQAWLPTIRHASYRQGLLSAGSRFHYSSPSKVLATLHNRGPSNLTDLKALVIDQIEHLAREIRDGNTNDWKRYWEGEKPCLENSCRDTFLSAIKRILNRFDVIAEPETSHADLRRSDIEFRYGQGMAVSAEVKKSDSPDLWSAIKDQLIPRYTRKPESEGHGIYLVFWFGNEFCRLNPGKKRPRDTDELRQMLEAPLLEEERSKVSVCVIDVSRPPGGAKSSPSKTETVSA